MNRILALLLAAVVLAGACGSSDDGTVAGGGEPTTTAGGGGHGDEHGAMNMKGAAACSPKGAALAVTARGTAFDTDCLAAPAGREFTIALDNRDTLTHNLVILPSHTADDVLFRGDIFQGPKTTEYKVPALEAGKYAFHCEVHPSRMKGTFVVA